MAEIFSHLTRKPAVKIDSTVGVEECSLAVGMLIGFESILFAFGLNSAVVIFVKTIDFGK